MGWKRKTSITLATHQFPILPHIFCAFCPVLSLLLVWTVLSDGWHEQPRTKWWRFLLPIFSFNSFSFLIMVQVFTIPFPPVCGLCSFSQIFTSWWLETLQTWLKVKLSSHCRWFSSADFGAEVTHYKQHVPPGDLFNCLRQVLVEPLHFSISNCWSIHLNQSNVSWFSVESHNNDLVADWFIKRSSDFLMNPDCHSWHALSKSTWVYYCVAIQCCEMPLFIPSHLGQLSLASLWGRLIEYQLRLG